MANLINHNPEVVASFLYYLYSSMGNLPEYTVSPYDPFSQATQSLYVLFMDCNLKVFLKYVIQEWDKFGSLVSQLMRTSHSYKVCFIEF